MPEIIDLFSQQPFTNIEITNAVEQIIPRPQLLSTLGVDLFTPVPSRRSEIAAYKYGRDARLIGTSPIGAPPERLEKVGGKLRRFGTRRLSKATTLYANELQGILQLPLYQAVQSAQAEIATRAAQIRDDLELTFEYHRLGAVLGLQLDADGETVLDDWYDNWGITRPAPYNMELGVLDQDPRINCRRVINRSKDASLGAWVENTTRLHALCGEEYFESLISHPMIRQSYLNYSAAADLRNEIPNSFFFGGIVWHDYRSALDPRFGIASNQARTFPVGATSCFQWVKGPAEEFFAYVNQPGQDTVSITFTDPFRGQYQSFEVYSYPLFMNLRPEMCDTLVMSD